MNRQKKEWKKKDAQKNYIHYEGKEIPAGHKRKYISYDIITDLRYAMRYHGYFSLNFIQCSGYNSSFEVAYMQRAWNIIHEIFDVCRKENIYCYILRYDEETYKTGHIYYLNVELRFSNRPDAFRKYRPWVFPKHN